MKHFLNSKTMWVAMLLTLVPQILNLITPEQLADWGIGNPNLISLIGLVVGWLRSVTKKPITISKSKATV